MIVLLTEVAKPYLSDFRMQAGGQRFGAFNVAEMSSLAHDTLFEVSRIGAGGQHRFIVVGFKHDVSGLSEVLFHVFRNMSGIRDEAEFQVADSDKVARVGRTVMGNIKRDDMKRTDFEAFVGFGEALVFRLYLFRHEMVALHPVVHGFRCIHWQVKFVGEHTNGFHMVCMVMRNKDGIDFCQGQAVIAEMLFEMPDTDTQVYHKTMPIMAQVIAISATAATETNELCHNCD